MNDINFKKTVGMGELNLEKSNDYHGKRRLYLSWPVDTLSRKWKRYSKEFETRKQTLESLEDVTLSDDRQRWEDTRREFEALRIENPVLVDGLLDHPDNRMEPPSLKH